MAIYHIYKTFSAENVLGMWLQLSLHEAIFSRLREKKIIIFEIFFWKRSQKGLFLVAVSEIRYLVITSIPVLPQVKKELQIFLSQQL